MKFPGAWVLFTVLAGCLFEANGPVCGTSVGCGNPGKLAVLQTTSVGCPGCSGGASPGIPFHVGFGDSLNIQFDTSLLAKADSARWEIILYQGFQVPAISPSPLDTLTLHAGAIVLHPQDLRQARHAYPESDTGVFPFAIHIFLRIYKEGLEFDNAGQLSGLGLDSARNQFFCSLGNPLLDSGKNDDLKAPLSSFQGYIESWRDYAGGAKAAYAYIPGSPYYHMISMTDGYFIIDSLPYEGLFELRLLIVPETFPSDGKVPSYILKSDPSDSKDRMFRIETTFDSLVIPENFP
jgi:hypothetical protein